MVSSSTPLAGRYKLGGKLATGGMGTVWIATDSRLERKVALKLLKDALAEDPRFVERFRREARAAGALSHPNIAGVFDYGEDDGRHFIVMELVEGRDLARLLREEGPLTEDRVARIGAQIADALGHAHAGGVIHRDIKPANVIVGAGDRVKVTDFGIARAQADSTLTATGSVLGTAQYLSPEQASGAEVTPASDVYSLGIVLFEMLTGSVPFTGDSAVAVAMRHVTDRVPPPSSLKPGVSHAMDSAVLRATASDPYSRFADARSLSGALRGVVTGTETLDTAAPTRPLTAAAGSTAVLGGTEVMRRDTTDWPFPTHPPRHDPLRLGRAVIALFVILALIAAGLLLYRLAQGDEEPRRRGGVAAPTTEEEPAPFALPDVTDREWEEASAELAELGLVVARENSYDDEYPPEIVMDSNPSPGSTVEEGDTVTLTVSIGSDDDEDDDDDDDEGEDGEIVPTDLESFTPPGQEKKEEKGDDD